ncbi:MAG: spore maturation protein [Ignavibacteria bacterium]|nr:spore maturation protein [Ignavibacteria bacterium]
MLNYVWIGLIFLGLTAALFYDVQDNVNNTFQNGKPIAAQIKLQSLPTPATSVDGKLVINKVELQKSFNLSSVSDIVFNCKISSGKDSTKYNFYAKIDKSLPELFQRIAKASGKDDDLTGIIELQRPDSTGVREAHIVFEKVTFSKMKEVVSSALHYAGTAVEIALGLIGVMAMWLGIMKVAEQANLISAIAKGVRPVTRFLFPDVPQDHPAIGAIIMNLSANFLGLGNAATPFGLKAMEELDKLNPEKGTATNAMCTFLAVNTAGMTLIPATAIALRAAAGSSDPAIIIGTSIFGSTCATIAGITAAKVLENFPLRNKTFLQVLREKIGLFITMFGIFTIVGILAGTGLLKSFFTNNTETVKNAIELIATFAIPLLIFIFLLAGIIKKVKVYEAFVEGAKEGFNIAIRIIPYLVAMLMAIAIFRAGGAMDWLIYLLRFITDPIGMPTEALPMALMRPLSGSGALGVMAEIMQVHGPDSFIGILSSTFFGSSETTFYVLAVYFGAVNIKRTRHALAAGLIADVAGVLGALFIVRMLFL